TNILPSQASNSGKFLATNGTDVSWATSTGGVTSITGTANEITVTGTTTPTLSLPSALTFTGKTVTGGTYSAPTFGTATPCTISAAGVVTVANATTSTSGSTGALTVAGGVGVAGTAYIAGQTTTAGLLYSAGFHTIGPSGGVELFVTGSTGASPRNVTSGRGTNIGQSGLSVPAEGYYGINSVTSGANVDAGNGANNDVRLYRDAAAVLALRNTTNAQTFRVYGTTTGNKYLSLSHDGTNAIISSSSGAITAGITFALKAYTVATLPATAATGMVTGATAYVSDALAPTFLAALTGGGAIATPVFYDGAAWVSF
ncbi:MAG: hypothetical protein WCL08_06090, partial [Verrucomicrobiota bacterium]